MSTIPEMELVRLFMQDVDVVGAVRRQGGIDPYLELLDLFYTDGQQRAPFLEELIGRQDMERYKIEVHGLKSAAANIGAGNLSAWAKRHEDKSDDPDYVESNAGALFTCYRKVLDEIKRVLRKQGYGRFAVRDDSSLRAIEPEDMRRQVADALAQLEDFASHEAAERVNTLLECAVPPEVRDQLEQIQTLLKLYEDDQAEESLRKLLDSLA